MTNVRRTLLKAIHPSRMPVNTSEFPGDVDVVDFKVPDRLNLELWTPEYLEQLDSNRFRANIELGDVISNDGICRSPKMVPWEEDGWEAIEVFDNLDPHAVPPFGKKAEGKGLGIYTVVRCARCVVPNIDPATGIRDTFVSKPSTLHFLCQPFINSCCIAS